jgi:hypothetical protein
MAGRHRKPSRFPTAHTCALLLCGALIATAATLTAVANDSRLLRAGALAAIFAAVLPLLMPDTANRPGATTSMEREVRQLRADVVRLTAALSTIRVTASAPSTSIPQRTTMLSLPLVRAALQVPVQSANGHKKLIDITDEKLASATRQNRAD